MYRVDVSGVSWPLLLVAGIFTAVGTCGVGTAFVSHGPLSGTTILPLLGGAFMLAGPLMAIIGMRQLIFLDEYVAALEGGLLVLIDKRETYLDWDEVEHVDWDAGQGALVVKRRAGEPMVISRSFSRGPAKDMAVRIEDVRRKAVFHTR